MKTQKKHAIPLALLAALFVLAGSNQLRAHEYTHDDHGYWDDHHAYHHWEYNHNHRGYWETRNGVRIFINL